MHFFSTFSHVKLHLRRQAIGVWRLLSLPSVWIGFFSANKWAVNVAWTLGGMLDTQLYCRIIRSRVLRVAALYCKTLMYQCHTVSYSKQSGRERKKQ